MDSLEARLQFIQVLKNLQKTLHKTRDSITSSSTTTPPSSQQKLNNDPIQFYLRNYRHHYEDFHQCLFDTTMKMDPLDRLDVVIYYVRIIRNLYPHSHSNTNVTKVLNEVLLMDIDLVFELCLPCQDWKSLTNQATCKELFLDLSKLIHYDATSVTHTPSDTTFIDATTWYSVKTERTTKDYKESLQRTESLLKDRDLKKLAFFQQFNSDTTAINPDLQTQPTNANILLHRMEADRELHKRSKETSWYIERPSNDILDESEFKSLWTHFETTDSGFDKDDYKNIKALNDIAKASYMY
ncbi:ANL_collapsed_G0039970.mRNA.1.CDS.1 [Saccharomyces cerevisiae]|nr:ANL_HP_G0014250.mRNA.1.CDS.1 [Saccharomyces cerevisiae]CAI5086283.1 ANL_HP_G0101290.mRNA.1.CDS.1 [Saccharomyces cerevisiae]CAI6565821.1 ANL_HP_G0014250.mRNA.1.CDS.1 [Saccharomyces cerevisiae]CAI6830073.1 ANL_collapsed_G0039970.mRNA.1.CDS.1 [Saccharomyces cerevisiae]CAI6969902.1 ANL_HP_G0101290.mRNA.1.CDS.1 [Saccharomyces cerevisiae]